MKLSTTALTTMALLAAACSGAGAAPTTTTVLTTLPPVVTTSTIPPPPTTSLPTTTTTTTIPLTPSPINGLGVADEVLLDRRVIAVKIDNHPQSRPQAGLEIAEAVFELLVEGGLTRFIALFHATDTDYVGPIRSARPTDPTLIAPLGAPFQISGGQDWIISRINATGVKLLGEGSSTYRISLKSAPHNLFGDTQLMRDRADGRNYPDTEPAPMFDFGEPPPSTTEAIQITLDWSSAPVVRWEWNGEQYLRFIADTPQNWFTQDGTEGQLAFDTLLVLTARRYTASPSSGQSGSSVPALETVGTGQAILFHAGLVVEGTWERGAIDLPFVLTVPGGDLLLPPGRLWISIFPTTSSLTWE